MGTPLVGTGGITRLRTPGRPRLCPAGLRLGAQQVLSEAVVPGEGRGGTGVETAQPPHIALSVSSAHLEAWVLVEGMGYFFFPRKTPVSGFSCFCFR